MNWPSSWFFSSTLKPALLSCSCTTCAMSLMSCRGSTFMVTATGIVDAGFLQQRLRLGGIGLVAGELLDIDRPGLQRRR